ncbi:MAG: cupin domain-containing protein [Gemmatimonadota bacterium]
MIRNRGRASQIGIALSLVAAGTLGLVLLPVPRESGALQSNFMGGSPSILDAEGLTVLRLRFPAGVRSNWHTHADGQLLMIEEGRGRTQVRGGVVEEVGPGQPWYTGPGIEHWHGAAPDSDVAQWTVYNGQVTWLDPVTDEQYRVAPGQR